MEPTAVRMPKLADTLVEGTVARWLKAVGDHVAAGEPLVEIETDKVSTELVAPAAGVLAELVVAEGQTVPIDAVIARIGGDQTSSPSAGPPVPPDSPPVGRAQPASTRRPTSVAARLMAEHGLSPEVVGDPTRRVTKQDVQRYVESQSETPTPPRSDTDSDRGGGSRTAPTATAAPTDRLPAPSTLQPLSSMRRAIADHMAKARATIPHGQTVMEADLTRLVAWREQEKAAFEAREGARLTFSVLFILALGRALTRPVGQASVSALSRVGTPAPPEQARPAGTTAVDIGVAVALDDGLIVPVVRGADTRSLGEIARAVDDLATRARAGRLAPAETGGALMTLTNVGSFGNLAAFPIVPLEQAGILGPGIVERRPLPTPDGGIRLGWRCLLGLVFDRRRLTDLAADRLLRAVVDELDRLAATADQPRSVAG